VDKSVNSCQMNSNCLEIALQHITSALVEGIVKWLTSCFVSLWIASAWLW
jgi:hypothetical protein